MRGVFLRDQFRHGIADGGGGHAAVGGSISNSNRTLGILKARGFEDQFCRTVFLFLDGSVGGDSENGRVAALEREIRQLALADFHIIAVIQIHRRLSGGFGFETQVVRTQFKAFVAVVGALIHAFGNLHLHVFGCPGLGGGLRLSGGCFSGQLHQEQFPVIFVGAVLEIDAGQTRMGEVAIQQRIRCIFFPLHKNFIRLGITGGNAFRHRHAVLQTLVISIGGFVAGQVRAVVVKEHKQFRSTLQGDLFQIRKHRQFANAILLAQLVDLFKQGPGTVLIGCHLKGNSQCFGCSSLHFKGHGQSNKQRTKNSDDSAKHPKSSLPVFNKTIISYFHTAFPAFQCFLRHNSQPVHDRSV